MPMRYAIQSAVLAAIGLVAGGYAGAEDKKADSPQKVESKRVKGEVLAAAVNFPAAYGLGFESLRTVGSRIDQARAAVDPICLAGLARELAVAEEVSGKKASITADALSNEAIELATMRHESAELKALAIMFKGHDAAKDLEALSAKAKKSEEDDAKAAREGERSRGIRTLVVQNGSNDRVWIYANGKYLGYVNPYHDFTFHVGHGPTTNTQLTAKASDGDTYRAKVVFGNYAKFTWNLLE
jgi:hypothetical protein